MIARLALSPEQSAALLPLMKDGHTLIAKVDREKWDAVAQNIDTAGRILHLEVGSVLTSKLPALREAIQKAAPKRGRKGGK